jgi:hypothetical protein
MFRLRCLEVGLGQDLGVELLGFLQVIPLKSLAIDLVDLVELLVGLRLERGEGANRVKVLPVPVAIATSIWRFRFSIASSIAVFASIW